MNKPPDYSGGLLSLDKELSYFDSRFNFSGPYRHTITPTTRMDKPKKSKPPISVSKVGKKKFDQLNIVWNIKAAKMLLFVLL